MGAPGAMEQPKQQDVEAASLGKGEVGGPQPVACTPALPEAMWPPGHKGGPAAQPRRCLGRRGVIALLAVAAVVAVGLAVGLGVYFGAVKGSPSGE